MPSTYSSSLRLELQATGENSNTWGTKTNNNLNLIEQAVAGYVKITLVSASATYNLTIDNASASDGRNAFIEFAGTVASAISVVVPDVEKGYWVKNSATGSNLTFRTSGGTGFTLPQNDWIFVISDGVSAYPVTTSLTNYARINQANTFTNTNNFTSAVTITGPVSITGATVITSATDIRANLSVTGTTNLVGNVVVSGATTLASAVDIKGATSLASTLVVGGATDIRANLSVTGATNLVGNVVVSGATTFASVVDIRGATSLASTLTVDSNIYAKYLSSPIGTDLTLIAANAQLVFNVTPGGTNFITSTAGTKFYKDVAVSGTFLVSGVTTLASAVDIKGATSLASTLVVGGNTVLNGSVSVSGSFAVSGASTFTSVVDIRAGLSVTGIANFTSVVNINTTGIVSVSAAIINVIAPSGVNFKNTVSVSGNFTVGGTARFLGITSVSVLRSSDSIDSVVYNSRLSGGPIYSQLAFNVLTFGVSSGTAGTLQFNSSGVATNNYIYCDSTSILIRHDSLIQLYAGPDVRFLVSASAAQFNVPARFVQLGDNPAGAVAGEVYYNTSANMLRCYNGTIWKDLF